MNSHFRYPKAIHVRTVSPPKYKRYRSFKKALRIEFGRTCVYCQLPDSRAPKGHWSFAVEHYRPKSIFHNLEREYSNLFYACQMCNAGKKDAWWQPDFIPNPCDVIMIEHLKFEGPMVTAKSEAGRRAIDQLHLNDPDSMQFRRNSQHIFEVLIKSLRDNDTTIRRANKAAPGSPSFSKAQKILSEANSRRERDLEAMLELCGTVNVRDEVLVSMGYRGSL